MLLTPILCNEFPDELLACKPFDSGTHLREPKLKHLNLGVSFFFQYAYIFVYCFHFAAASGNFFMDSTLLYSYSSVFH